LPLSFLFFFSPSLFSTQKGFSFVLLFQKRHTPEAQLKYFSPFFFFFRFFFSVRREGSSLFNYSKPFLIFFFFFFFFFPFFFSSSAAFIFKKRGFSFFFLFFLLFPPPPQKTHGKIDKTYAPRSPLFLFFQEFLILLPPRRRVAGHPKVRSKQFKSQRYFFFFFFSLFSTLPPRASKFEKTRRNRRPGSCGGGGPFFSPPSFVLFFPLPLVGHRGNTVGQFDRKKLPGLFFSLLLYCSPFPLRGVKLTPVITPWRIRYPPTVLLSFFFHDSFFIRRVSGEAIDLLRTSFPFPLRFSFLPVQIGGKPRLNDQRQKHSSFS